MVGMKRNNIYKVAEICIDKDGNLSVGYLGDVAEQGGFTFGWGQIGIGSLKGALTFIEEQITKHKEEYNKLIIKKENE